MDRTANPASSAEKRGPSRWVFVPGAMPKVAKLMVEKRKDMGHDHVALCWQKGVVECLPGWFYAREGALAIGVPWDDLETLYADTKRASQTLLVLRDPKEVPTDGAH